MTTINVRNVKTMSLVKGRKLYVCALNCIMNEIMHLMFSILDDIKSVELWHIAHSLSRSLQLALPFGQMFAFACVNFSLTWNENGRLELESTINESCLTKYPLHSGWVNNSEN